MLLYSSLDDCCQNKRDSPHPMVMRVVLCVCLSFSSGCQLFKSPNEDTTSTILPPIVAPRENIQLEFMFIDRPIGDPLVGGELWEQVDQIATLSSEQRTALATNGWKVGHANSHPPRALEELLELNSSDGRSADGKRQFLVRRVAVPSGGDVPVDVTETIPELDFSLKPGDRAEKYKSARGVLKLTVQREQDGWVKLSFLPEIHHGNTWLRPIATQFNWTSRRSQAVLPLYDQKFSLNLNVGEMALITSAGDDVKKSGYAFFRSIDPTGQVQRLLVVRIANMRRVQPVYAN
jgi:hypothetical protein